MLTPLEPLSSPDLSSFIIQSSLWVHAVTTSGTSHSDGTVVFLGTPHLSLSQHHLPSPFAERKNKKKYFLFFSTLFFSFPSILHLQLKFPNNSFSTLCFSSSFFTSVLTFKNNQSHFKSTLSISVSFPPDLLIPQVSLFQPQRWRDKMPLSHYSWGSTQTNSHFKTSLCYMSSNRPRTCCLPPPMSFRVFFDLSLLVSPIILFLPHPFKLIFTLLCPSAHLLLLLFSSLREGAPPPPLLLTAHLLKPPQPSVILLCLLVHVSLPLTLIRPSA